jgi:tetratricopeptide (TPR) repeat protein
MSVKKFDLAIDLMKLNIHAFPEYIGSYTHLANLLIRKGERLQAEELLLKALSINPDSAAATKLLEQVR